MFRRFKFLYYSLSLLLLTTGLRAQPCLPGWAYRVPVIIDNTGNPETLTDYQIKVRVNTQLLIVNKKAKLDGSDIRFISKTGSVLPFWVEKGTYNTSETEFWVKVETIPGAAKDTIYLFYGEPGAESLVSGAQAFDIFDDFNGATINTTTWNVCNPGRISVSNSLASFSSGTGTNEKSYISSKTLLDFPVIVEASVKEVSQGLGFLGLQNQMGQGYAMVYEVNQQPVIRMLEIMPDPNCVHLDDVNPANNAARSASTTSGIWAFTWLPGNVQKYSWPGAVSAESWVDNQVPHSGTISAAIGNINRNGSITVEWIRARKYTAVEPVTSLGTEVASVVSASASSNAPVCEGSELILSAATVPGAVYNWSGPEGFAAAGQQVQLQAMTPAIAGKYVLTVSIPEGCFSATDTVDVLVSQATLAGTAIGAREVCSSDNNGTIELTFSRGSVLRWESSPTAEGPWNEIVNNTNQLDYKDLQTTTYYRAVVKNGVCSQLNSNSIRIRVDQPAVGGVITGTPEGCMGSNSGIVQLTGHRSEIMNWQYKKEGAETWTDITGTTYTHSYKNLTVSTWYRARIRNGACPQVFSDSVFVKINPLPQLSFHADPVCFREKTVIVNNSRISSGTLKNFYWEFSDGTSSIAKSPVHTFPNSGTYTIKLRAESDKGCISIDSADVVVKALPVVDFNFSNVCHEFPAEFSSNVLPEDGILEYAWDFGDGSGTSPLRNPAYTFNQDGKYNVKLKIRTVTGCLDSISKEITIYPRAIPDFSADTVFLGEKTRFQNLSSISSGNLSYFWSFGDGNNSTLPNPEHEYKSPGQFNVQLITHSSYGLCKDTIVKPYYVKDQTRASFSFVNVCLYDSARFANTSYIASGAKSYFWDFGDGETSSLENPSHLYKNPGTYSVKLTVTSLENSRDEVVKNITIYSLPVSRFVTSAVCDQEPARFTNLSSIPSGTLSYQWDFGDQASSNEDNPEHLYAEKGDYLITLIAVSDKSCKDTSTYNLTIFPKPEPLFSVEDVCFGGESVFKDLSTIESGSIAEYLWSFGEGSNSVEKEPVKIYSQPGNYSVQLKVKSEKGCQAQFTSVAKVIDNPAAQFSTDDACFGKEVKFFDLSDAKNSQLSYEWKFGDEKGGTSTLPEPVYLYDYPGTYLVTLIVENSTAEKCRDSISIPVQVFPLPTIDATGTATISKGLSTPLQVTGGASYLWEPSNSLDFNTISNPMATPYETTTYTVIGTDKNGCTGKDQVEITVENNFLLFPSNVITPDGNGQNDTWYVGNIEAFPEAKVLVVDRWGKKVFEKSAYTNDWEGVGGTDILPEGDYYYIISSPETEKAYTGTITIIRSR